jgi:glycosyltransferase involved in cell wall biosynthesis
MLDRFLHRVNTSKPRPKPARNGVFGIRDCPKIAREQRGGLFYPPLQMLFSIVIPTCNRYPALRVGLAALHPDAQGIPASDYEIIVSDDSPDEFIEKNPAPGLPWVQTVQGPRRGPAANRNCGAKHARGTWLIFMDDDCIPQPSFLKAYRDAIHEHPACRVFEGCTRADRPKERMDEESPVNETGGYLWSCNFAIRGDLFGQVEGFCEAFPYAAMEDVDLRVRLAQSGEPFLFVPKAQVLHPWRPVALSMKVLRVQLVSQRLFYSRHPEERPSFLRYLHTIARPSCFGLLVEAPRLAFRGVWRWLGRQLVNILVDLMVAVNIPRPGAAAGRAE